MRSQRLKKKYFEEIIPNMKEEMKYSSPMQVPRLVKICINQGLGAAIGNSKLIEIAIGELSAISGQKAIPRKAKKSVSNFKLREEMPIGVMVTLRGAIMFEFLDRFVTISLPRVRDFRGLKPNCFDGQGNCTIGITEQIIFPEISMDKINRITGMNVTFVTNTNDDNAAFVLLKSLGLPFIKTEKYGKVSS